MDHSFMTKTSRFGFSEPTSKVPSIPFKTLGVVTCEFNPSTQETDVPRLSVSLRSA